MHRHGLLLCALLLCASLLLGAAAAPILPSTDYYVNDEVGFLFDDHRTGILTQAKALEEATGVQLVVLLVEDPDPLTQEQYADAIFAGWQIGGPQGNGVLLLVCTDDLGCRVVVGEALAEELSTETLTQLLEDSTMAASFSGGNVSAGTYTGFRVLAAELYRLHGLEPPEELTRESRGSSSPWSPAVFVIFALVVIFGIRSMRLSSKYQKRAMQTSRKRRSYAVERRDDDRQVRTTPRQQEIDRLKRIALEERAEFEEEERRRREEAGDAPAGPGPDADNTEDNT